MKTILPSVWFLGVVLATQSSFAQQPANQQPSAFDTGRQVGEITFYVVIAVVILYIGARLLFKKKS